MNRSSAVQRPVAERSAALSDLRRNSVLARLDIIETLWRVGSGHSGPSMSIVDILVCLYFAELRVDPARPDWEERDRFVLSKGHGALALYAVLARAGFFPREELFTFESLGSRLQGHPDCLLTPGVEMSTGSLGQGLSVSIGHALGARMRETEARAYCLLGDGESQEGNVWEAAMAAAKFRLDNLVAIVDWNRLQGGVTAEVMPTLEPFGAKWEAFGWHVVEVDGHDHAALLSALSQARETEGRPTVLLAHTVKGKGVSFMENDPEWHSGKVGDEEYRRARAQLEDQLATVGGEA